MLNIVTVRLFVFKKKDEIIKRYKYNITLSDLEMMQNNEPIESPIFHHHCFYLYIKSYWIFFLTLHPSLVKRE